MPASVPPKILLDADVISHFIAADHPALLPAVFPGRLALLPQVEEELRMVRSLTNSLDTFLRHGRVERLELPPQDYALAIEYSRLQRHFSKGESACITLARHRGYHLASSHLPAIGAYCEEHHIPHYTTLDILCLAKAQNQLSETECNAFICLVQAQNGRLPCRTYQEFIERPNRRFCPTLQPAQSPV